MSTAPAFSKRLLDTVDVGVISYGADGRLTYVNPAYAELLCADRETVEGRAVWELTPALSRDSFEEYWDSFDVGAIGIEETTHAVGDTTVDVSLLTTCVVVDGERQHVGTVLDGRRDPDRTGGSEYQRSLLKAQQEATIDGILIVDENDEIISYNRRFAEMWNVPETLIDEKDDEPVLGRVVDQVKKPDEFLDRVEHLYDHPGEDSRDLIELRDGRIFDRYSTSVADEETYYGRLWVFRDITERVERENRLERQNRHLDQFASVVSHDLRNPLNVAEGRLTLAMEECDNDHLEAIEGALDRMDTLIDDMLTLTREGQAVEELEPVDLSTVARESWTNVEGEDATLHVDAEFTVRADESRLSQAFENLYRNAIEHGGPGVTVSVGTLPDGFYVRDDGPGVPPDVRDEVFDVGFTTTTSGTGFGLSIVREIVDAHGWTIDVADGPDGGTRFEIRGVDGVE
ncbi:MAG: ATP-binding protein [Haloferacaceae archaeon]